MFNVNNKVTFVNFEHISHLCSRVSIVNFEQVNAGWYSSMILGNATSVTKCSRRNLIVKSSCPVHLGSSIKLKIILNFYFDTSLRCLKRFYGDFLRHYKEVRK